MGGEYCKRRLDKTILQHDLDEPVQPQDIRLHVSGVGCLFCRRQATPRVFILLFKCNSQMKTAAAS